MYTGLGLTSYLTINKHHARIRAIIGGTGEYFLERPATTDWLSMWNQTFLPAMWGPQVARAVTAAYISRQLIERLRALLREET